MQCDMHIASLLACAMCNPELGAGAGRFLPGWVVAMRCIVMHSTPRLKVVVVAVAVAVVVMAAKVACA